MQKQHENECIQNDEYILRKRTFEMFLSGVCVISCLCVILNLLEQQLRAAAILYAAQGILSLFLRLYVRHRERYMSAAVIYICTVGFLLLPAAFTLDGGMFGPIPIWACVHIMFMFLFFSGRLLYVLFVGILLEYGYLLSRIYFHPYSAGVPADRLTTFTDYLFCFLTAVFWLELVLHTQKISVAKENRRTEENNEIIKEAGTARNRFFSDIAFEMRIPVNSVLAVTELLLKEEPDRMIRAEINGIKSASYDILSVIDDALIYSSLEAGKIEPENRPYHFENLFQSIMDSVSDQIMEKNLLLFVVAAPDIPRLLLGDSRRIRQIFTHLLTASLAMTTEGRIMVNISFQQKDHSDEITFRCTVSDTGKGIDTENAAQLFDAYPDSVGLKFCISRGYLKLMGGTIDVKGIKNVGMTTCFTFQNRVLDASPMIQVLKAPKPRVLVYTEEDFRIENWQTVMAGFHIKPCYVHNRHRFETEIRDTKYEYIFFSRRRYGELLSIIAFYHCEENTYIIADSCDKYGDFGKCRMIRRPLSCINLGKVLNDEWRGEDYQVACNRENFTAGGSRILVIDDNTVNLKVSAGIFAKYEVDIDIAASGEEGLKKMEKERYDLVFLDLIMPEMNGETVLSHIRELPDEHYKKVPVIGVSSNTEEDMKEYVLKKGFQGFLEKPIKWKNIEECMLQFLPQSLIISKEKKATEARKEEFPAEERGLQVRKGLSNIGYNEEAYAAILNTYYRENLKKLETLTDIFRKEELSVFVSAVHGIKSTSASIGAMGLSSLARELEYAGKDKDLSFISDKLPPFLKEYQLILEEIREYLVTAGKMETVLTAPRPDTKEEALTEEPLKELKEKMDRMDLKACTDSLTRLIMTNFGEKNNDTVRRMKEAYDRFDFHLAKKELNRLLEACAEACEQDAQ